MTVAGDRKGLGARLVSTLTGVLASDLVSDKQAEHAVLASSGADWTEVRPPRLTEADRPESWFLVERAPGLAAKPVTKVDVARAMVALAESQDWVRRSPFLVAR